MKNDIPLLKNVFDHSLFTQNKVDQFNRIALFVVFYWFGILKIFSLSPAESLINKLYLKTISSWISLDHFLVSLGVLECTIAILLLFPKYTKLAFILFSIQMFTTFLPMIYLPNEVWQNGVALTLTGQYIMKNVVLIACAITVWKGWQTQSMQH